MANEARIEDKPHWPRVAASVAVIRDGTVLLVERGKGPRRGVWSLPGGHVEPGETARAAAARELAEETGIDAEIMGLIDVHDVIMRRDDGELTAHYLLTVFYGRWTAGEPVAASDVAAARFVPFTDVGEMTLTPGAVEFIDRARALVARGGPEI